MSHVESPTEPNTHCRRTPAKLLAIVAGLTLVGAVPRFYGLDSRDFWFDESCTFIYVHNLFNWPAGSSLLTESTNLPYYVLLRGWSSLFGDSEAAYRSFSALTSVLTIPLLALAAFRLAGVWAGAICAAFAAFHPLHIYYAHEARAYALWVLLLAGTTLLLVEAGRRNSWRLWAMFGAVLVAALHTHYFTLFWMPFSLCAAFLAKNRRAVLRKSCATLLLVVLAFAPYAYFAMLPAARGGGAAWIAPEFEAPKAIPQTLWAFMPAGAYPSHLRGLSLDSPDKAAYQPQTLQVAARVLPALLVTCMILMLIRRGLRVAPDSASYETLEPIPKTLTPSPLPGRERGYWDRLQAPEIQPSVGALGWTPLHLLLAGLTLGPLAAALLYSILIRPVYLAGRYDLVAWPGAILWLSILVTQFAAGRRRHIRRPLILAAAGLLVLFSLVPIHRILAFHPPTSFHRVRAERLAELTGPNDLVVAFSYDRDYLTYYLHRAGFGGALCSFPTWLEAQVGWVDTKADLGRIAEAVKDGARLALQVRQALTQGATVAVLSDSMDVKGMGPRSPVNRAFLDALSAVGVGVHPFDLELGIHTCFIE